MKVSILGLGLVAPGVEDAFRIRALPELAEGRAKRLTRLERMALAAAQQALAPGTETQDLALVLGTGYGGLAATADFLDGIGARGAAFGSPIAFQQSVHHSPAGQLSILLGCHGPSLTTSAREISGESALQVATTLLGGGRAEKVLVVAADEWTETLAAGYRAFECREALSLGEGAAAVLLGKEPGPLSVESCTLMAHPCPILRFPTREQMRPLLFEGASARRGVTSVSLSAANEEVLEAETSVLAEMLPSPSQCTDTNTFGFHASAGLLRVVAAARRLQASPDGSACAVHGLALGGGQSLIVVRHVGT
jgi:3-oxoacyl-[acyl-carrier-protein] synthase III